MDCTPKNASTAFNSSSSSSAMGHNGLPDLCDFDRNCGESLPWGWYAVMLFLASVTCSANITSLVVLSRLRTALPPVLRLALMNLSVTDSVGSLSFIYHSLMSKLNTKTVGIECKIRYLFYVGMNVVTIYTLIYITVERLIAVTLPFLHVRIDGKKFTAVALTLIWIFSLSTLASGMHRLKTDLDLCIYHVMVPKTTHLLNATLALPTIVFIVTSNLALYANARREIIKIGRTLVGAESNTRDQLAEMAEKAASTTLAIVVPFAVFNTPLYLLMLVFYASPEFMYSCLSVVLLTVFSTLLVLNSLCNPIIYAWKLRPVQAELKKMIPFLARKSGPLGVPVTKTTIAGVQSTGHV
ncbi:delta-type opioid receptor-like [Elysia marginata]|uniref:Delta-type opioid receptor-like n=1 Tax=Elysia marginata TaxID=1093978 RepID=A0AAV4GBF3_9GAST|nr:delta-type opioid receptor-like [Elysia marginata]